MGKRARGAYAKALSKLKRGAPMYDIFVECVNAESATSDECWRLTPILTEFDATCVQGYHEALNLGWTYAPNGDWTCPSCAAREKGADE